MEISPKAVAWTVVLTAESRVSNGSRERMVSADPGETGGYSSRSRLTVTAKTATPTKVDSKLSDVHLESLERREGEKGCH